MAPTLGFSGYQPLMRAYIGQGMRQDQMRLDKVRVDALLASLRKHGVSEELIDTVINEIDQDNAANMRVTTKGQVTIPRNIRETMGITPKSEVEFVEENGKFFIVKSGNRKATGNLRKLEGIATVKMSTDEILELTRELT